MRVRPEVAVNSEMQNYCLDLLHGACLPLETISHVFAYGSGAIPQKGEDTREKMVKEFKKINIKLEILRLIF